MKIKWCYDNLQIIIYTSYMLYIYAKIKQELKKQ